MKKIVLIHLIVWLLLSVIYFFFSGSIVELIFPTIHGVVLWSITLFAGLIAIFILVIISLIANVIYRKRKRRAKSCSE